MTETAKTLVITADTPEEMKEAIVEYLRLRASSLESQTHIHYLAQDRIRLEISAKALREAAQTIESGEL